MTDTTKDKPKSEVEAFYLKTQSYFDGNIPWEQLPPWIQQEFVQAVNVVIQVSALKTGV